MPFTLPHVLLGCLGLAALHILYQYITVNRRHRQSIEKFCCTAPARYPHKDPLFGLDMLWATFLAVKSRCYLEQVRSLYQQIGNTFSSHSLGSSYIHTNEPDNIQAVLSTNFKDYFISPGRKAAFLPLLGQSILISDGVRWDRSRALLRPGFTRSQVGDLLMFEEHVNNLIQALPRDGSVVDLSEYFFRLASDVTTDFMFGESIGSLLRINSFAVGLHGSSSQSSRWLCIKMA